MKERGAPHQVLPKVTGDSSPKTGPADGKQAREEEDAAGMQCGADQEADHQM